MHLPKSLKAVWPNKSIDAAVRLHGAELQNMLLISTAGKHVVILTLEAGPSSPRFLALSLCFLPSVLDH